MAAGHACQRHATKPIGFQVIFRGNTIFNREVQMDLMYLDGQPVLHIIDTWTNFSVVRFVSSVDTETIWDTLATAWITFYMGNPEFMLIDEESALNIKEWYDLCAEADIKVTVRGTESHNSLRQGETYHTLL